MNGQIVKYSERLGQGIIRSDDGRTYRFKQASLTSRAGRLVGMDVDFLVESRQPRDIFVLSGTPWTAFSSAR